MHFRQPTSNVPYWTKKIANNRARDRMVNKVLKSKGWRVIRVWEHSLKPKNRQRLVVRLKRVVGLPS